MSQSSPSSSSLESSSDCIAEQNKIIINNYDYDQESVPSKSSSSSLSYGSAASVDAKQPKEPKLQHQTNYIQTLMHLLNGFIGSGILSMPMTFKNGGLLLSTILNPFIGLLSCHCIHMLIQINRLAMDTSRNSNKNNQKQQQAKSSIPLDYHELAEFAFSIGPARFRCLKRLARYYVLGSVIAAQLGGCCVYFLFIATNTKKFLSHLIGPENTPNQFQCLCLVLPFVIGINFIRNLRKLTLFSTISNLLQIISLGIIFYNLFNVEWKQFPNDLPLIGDKIPQFFVQSLFIFEGISVSMSLYKAIDKPENFSRKLGVLNIGLFLIGLCYFSLGFIGYACYGLSVEGSITINLPNSLLNDSVQFMYSLAVLLTYPIILYVPIQYLWPILDRFLDLKLFNYNSNDKCRNNGNFPLNRNWKIILELIFRASLVLLTFILAAVIPKLDMIISLVGSITSISIAVIIPSTLHLITFYPKYSRSSKIPDDADSAHCFNGKLCFLLTKNLFIMLIGWCGFFLGTYFSLMDIIKSYNLPVDVHDDYDSTIIPNITTTITTITTIPANLLQY